MRVEGFNLSHFDGRYVYLRRTTTTRLAGEIHVVRRYVENGLRDISEIDPPWENPEVCWQDRSGAYTIVKCDTQWDYQLETYFLAHCLGTKNHAEFSKAHAAYSLRDRLGIPHATILCLRENEYSPYGGCWDIGGYLPFWPSGESPLRILQVRGRNDAIAMSTFHAYVRDWYASHGGRMQVDVDKFVAYLEANGDSDVNYHFRYLLDEEHNYFGWGHWNAHQRRIARMNGTSL